LLLSKKAPEGIDTATLDAEVILPSAPTVTTGILLAEPYVPAVTAVFAISLVDIFCCAI
jgi:hypothetical protein